MYFINGVVTSDLGANPIVSDTVLADYLRESDLPDGALLKDARQTGETSTNQELADNLLQINPLDYMAAGSVPSDAIEITGRTVGAPAGLSTRIRQTQVADVTVKRAHYSAHYTAHYYRTIRLYVMRRLLIVDVIFYIATSTNQSTHSVLSLHSAFIWRKDRDGDCPASPWGKKRLF